MTAAQSRTLRTAADMHALRADEAFHEGAMSVLTYPTAPPVAFFSHESPKYLGGLVVQVGDTVHKDAAGNFTATREVAA